MSNRSVSYDFLKFIGMIGIYLAHTLGKPVVLDYIRNYEVILLVIVSGVFLSRKTFSSGRDYFVYLKDRIQRLVYPTWAFLTILFLGINLICIITHQPFPYSKRIIIESYTMMNGIGYVWIMLVYCLIAIGTPVLVLVLRKIEPQYHYCTVLILWVLYEGLLSILMPFIESGVIGYAINNIILYLIAYSIIASMGYIIDNIGDKQYKTIIFSVLIFGIHLVSFLIPAVQNHTLNNIASYKYPPTYIYVSYGIPISLLLISVSNTLFSLPHTHRFDTFFAFFGRRINWIYFNHIFMIYIWNMLISIDNWVMMFAFISVGSIISTFLIDCIIEKIKKRVKSSLIMIFIKKVWG